MRFGPGGSSEELINVATNRILGRIAAGTGPSQELTPTQVTAMLDLATTSAKGLAPILPNDATKFLNGLGAYAVPASGVTAAAWAAGTYAIGSLVTAGSYMWMAPSSTSTEPIFDEGDLGSSSDWTYVPASGSNGSQGSGKIVLIDTVNGKSACAYRQQTRSGFLSKLLVVDCQISGSADALFFGIYDSTASQAGTSYLQAGAYGVEIDIFNSKVTPILNGSQSTPVTTYSNAHAVNGGTSTFTRFYLAMIQNGSNWDLHTYRNRWWYGATNVSSTTDVNRDNCKLLQREDIVKIGESLNIARPAFTTWRPYIGARTGGANGKFSVNRFQTYDFSSAWIPVGRS